MIEYYDDAIKAALKIAEHKLFRIYKFLGDGANKRISEIMDIVKDHIEQDCNRRSDYAVSRVNPVLIGKAFNAHPNLWKDGNIYLVDASTRAHNTMSGFKIQGKSLRQYVPSRGGKSDRNYKHHIKTLLWGLYNNSDYIAEMIMKIKTERGSYRVDDLQTFRRCAPKVCLLYCNMTEDNRCVLMLRPSGGKLSRVVYNVYCHTIMEAMRIRNKGLIDSGFLATFQRLKKYGIEMNKSLNESIVVRDNQLIIKPEEAPKELFKLKAEDCDNTIRAPKLPNKAA